jgi:N-acetylmuramoyl-L-alanine amidase
VRQSILLRHSAGFIFLLAMGFYAEPMLAQSIKGPYTTTADVPLRSGPGMNYEVITTLPKGIAINVVAREGYWLRVESQHGGKAGYIDEQFAQPGAPAGAVAPATATPSVAGSYRTLQDVDLRAGPGTNYPVVTKIRSGVKVNVVRAEGDWLRIVSKKGNKPGYLEKRSVGRSTDRN